MVETVKKFPIIGPKEPISGPKDPILDESV
jgi:hypothetical protein